MTGTDLCVNKLHKSRSYLNHLVNCNNAYNEKTVTGFSHKIIILVTLDDYAFWSRCVLQNSSAIVIFSIYKFGPL